MKKRLFTLLLALVMVLGLAPMGLPTAEAATKSGKCGDNATWTLTDDGTLTISGTGEMWSRSNWTNWNNDYGKSIKKGIINKGITNIGSDTFKNCAGLTSVSIPNSVTSIGWDAFYGCTGLTELTIPSGVRSGVGGRGIYGCSNLKKVHVAPDNATYTSDGIAVLSRNNTMLDYCPEGYSGSYTLPSTVTSLLWPALVICEGLTRIDVAAGNTAYSSDGIALFNRDKDRLVAFPKGYSGDYVIPNSVKTIGEDPLRSCTGLTKIAFAGQAPYISSDAFFNIAASVYYPGWDETWTEEVRKSYGGNLTWKPYTRLDMLAVTPKTTPVSTSAVKVSWSKVSDAQYYQVWRMDVKGKTPGACIGIYDANTTSCTSRQLKPGTTYYYRVRAYKYVNGKKVFGEYTPIIKGTTKPAAPSDVTATATGRDTVKVTWSKAPGAQLYQVWRMDVKGKTPGVCIGIYTADTLSCTSRQLKPGATYYYRVRAYKKVDGKNIYGDYSPTVSATTKK